MAESILLELTSNILSSIASPVIRKIFEKEVCIWDTRDELRKLQMAIEKIRPVLVDAETKQERSDDLNNWIKRLKGVLYDAEDLFDEVLTEDLLNQQMRDRKNKVSVKSKVRVSFPKLNLTMSGNSFAKEVKVIRKRLLEISTDMAHFGFVNGHPNDPTISMRRKAGSSRPFINEKYVIGRDEDKNVILKMLIRGDDRGIAVYGLEGIGGMGKSTLAHWIYNDELVKQMFEERWFACISKISDEKDFLGRIYQSISGEGYSDLTEIQLEDKIRGTLAGKKYLLVLDDVWQDHHGIWKNRKSLLSCGATGSKIFVTTRLPSVASAMGAVRVHSLRGLSENDSWDLFKSLAFLPGCETDPIKESLGRNLLTRCSGVPLAILFLGSLLHGRTIQEWEEIARLSAVGAVHNDEVMSILKLSYDQLPSNLKQCFTYCSLFPRDYRYKKDELIYHWVAQGYLDPPEAESGFMSLLDMGIFQDEEKDGFGSIQSCKMHDILHDLALYLAGKENINLTSGTTQSMSSSTRFASLMAYHEENAPLNIPESLLTAKSLRSCLLSRSSFVGSQPNLKQLSSSFKVLRTLTLSGLGIKDIPPSIGELKLLRYLDLSYNNFEKLPDSLTNLANLGILNLESCSKLKQLPPSFKKLVKLCSLSFRHCDKLNLMPEGIGEMPDLQYLSDFKVGKENELGVLTGLLKQLRGGLSIRFCGVAKAGKGWMLKLPDVVSLNHLDLSFYPGQTIRGCGINECTSELVSLKLSSCENIKHLPPLSCFPILKWLHLENLSKLEFLEEEELSTCSYKSFFPCLEVLILDNMPRLSRLQGKVAATPSASSVLEFPRLSKLGIVGCPNLELSSLPTCRRLRELHLENVGNITPAVIRDEMLSTIFCSSNRPPIEKIVLHNCKRLSTIPGEALASLRELDIRSCSSLKSLHLASPHLLDVRIEECGELMSIEVAQSPKPSLKFLRIKSCRLLKGLLVDTHLGASLEVMEVADCPELRLSNAQGKMPAVKRGLYSGAETRRLVFQDLDSEFIRWCLSSLSMRYLKEMIISGCKGPLSLPGLELVSLQQCQIEEADGLGSLQFLSPHLGRASFKNCAGLTSVEVEAPTCIEILFCSDLQNLLIARPDALEEVTIFCASSADLGWDSISNLGDRECVRKIELGGVDSVFLEGMLSYPRKGHIGSVTVALASLEELSIEDIHGLKNLSLKSERLNRIHIKNCNDLTSVDLYSPCLYWDSSVAIHHCSQLKNVRIPRRISLRRLTITDCPDLSLSTGLDWDSLTDLDSLKLRPMPPLQDLQLQLPKWLLQRHDLDELWIEDA